MGRRTEDLVAWMTYRSYACAGKLAATSDYVLFYLMYLHEAD